MSRFPSLRSLGLAFAVASSACGDDEPAADGGGQCYPLDPELPVVPPSVPHCGWLPGEFPAPPDGYDKTNRVSVHFTPTDEEPCDPCNVELFDMLLEAEIERECDQPYAAFQRGCYRLPEGGPGVGHSATSSDSTRRTARR